MRRPKLETMVWPCIVAGLCATVVISYRRELNLRDSAARDQRAASSLAGALVTSKRISYDQVGKELRWPEALVALEIATVPRPERPLSQPGTQLVLVLSELSCSVCEETETAAANKIAAQSSSVQVLAVVAAKQRRYAAAYARVNNVQFPVYFDEQGAFASVNKLAALPIMLVVRNGVVIGANAPVTGQPDVSVPFHEAALKLLRAPAVYADAGAR